MKETTVPPLHDGGEGRGGGQSETGAERKVLAA